MKGRLLMDQKNTIVKCKARPDCLFNYNGVCDNYVISIGKNGKCDCYVETTTCQDCEFYEDKKLLQNKCSKDEHYYLRTAPICDSFQETTKRGQRANCNIYDSVCDEKPVIKIPDPKDMNINFVIQNAWCNEELLRDQMCWFCDSGEHGKCKLTSKPALDRTGKCPYYKSTGGNR